MRFARKRRAAFTLTEMLMAAGILGIGLTMVASIFPVAVDQSRRSRDQTMAALCARSVMARIRADRNEIYNSLRGRTKSFIDFYSDADLKDLLPGKHIIYKPSAFLYTNNRAYEGLGTWDAGNYVARFFATGASVDGPYRLTIVICRSIGKSPPSTEYWPSATNPIPGPGTYVVHIVRAYCMGYLIDYIDYSTVPRTGYFAVGASFNNATSANSTNWQRVPDAVAVYHTMLGE